MVYVRYMGLAYVSYMKLGYMAYVSYMKLGYMVYVSYMRFGCVDYDKVHDLFSILSTTYHLHNMVVDNRDHCLTLDIALFFGMRSCMNDQLGSYKRHAHTSIIIPVQVIPPLHPVR